jgi:hypothetical protein
MQPLWKNNEDSKQVALTVSFLCFINMYGVYEYGVTAKMATVTLADEATVKSKLNA